MPTVGTPRMTPAYCMRHRRAKGVENYRQREASARLDPLGGASLMRVSICASGCRLKGSRRTDLERSQERK